MSWWLCSRTQSFVILINDRGCPFKSAFCVHHLPLHLLHLAYPGIAYQHLQWDSNLYYYSGWDTNDYYDNGPGWKEEEEKNQTEKCKKRLFLMMVIPRTHLHLLSLHPSGQIQMQPKSSRFGSKWIYQSPKRTLNPSLKKRRLLWLEFENEKKKVIHTFNAEFPVPWIHNDSLPLYSLASLSKWLIYGIPYCYVPCSLPHKLDRYLTNYETTTTTSRRIQQID